MNPLQPAEDLIEHFEGRYRAPYLCPARLPTVGVGHLIKRYEFERYGVIEPRPRVFRLIDPDAHAISYEEIDAIFAMDVAGKAAGVMGLVKRGLTPNQFGALLSFAFNLGIGNLRSSTLLKVVNSGHDEEVRPQLMRWVHSRGRVLSGLIRRRQAEADLYERVNQ